MCGQRSVHNSNAIDLTLAKIDLTGRGITITVISMHMTYRHSICCKLDTTACAAKHAWPIRSAQVLADTILSAELDHEWPVAQSCLLVLPCVRAHSHVVSRHHELHGTAIFRVTAQHVCAVGQCLSYMPAQSQRGEVLRHDMSHTRTPANAFEWPFCTPAIALRQCVQCQCAACICAICTVQDCEQVYM